MALYLASQSPRRQQLLTQVGIEFTLLLPDEGEDVEALEVPKPDEPPAAYARRVARLKLEAAVKRLERRKLPRGPVLCADTTVALGTKIFGKPADSADAVRMLKELAGRTHRVITAVAVRDRDHFNDTLSESRVTFGPITPQQIRRYVKTGEPMGKAGAYAVQGAAAAFIPYIDGSYSGIMGLPLYETLELLRQF